MTTGKIIQADKVEGLADQPNFLVNPNGLFNTTGWTEGSYTAGAKPTGNFTASSGAGKFSIARTTTNPLGMTGTSLVLTKSSGNQQGRAVETSFALPLSYRAKVLQIEIDYILNSTDFLPGTNLTNSSLIWYCAFSNDNGATYTLAEPSSFKMLSDSQTISDKLTASIQSPYDATNMKLIAYVSQNDPFTWTVKCITKVSPSQYVYGTPVVDLGEYTPVFTNLGTVTTQKFEAYRIGKKLRVKFRFTAASGGASVATVGLPPGLTVSSTGNTVVGAAWTQFTTSKDVFVVASNGATTVRFITNNGIGADLVGSDFGSGIVDGWFEVDILGWSSSVQVSDGYDGRVVAARATLSADVTGVSGSAVLPFNTVGFDSTGSFNTITNSYKIPSSGIYRITAHVRFTTLSTNAEMGIPLLLNGTTIDYIGTQSLPAGGLAVISGSTTRQLNAGQEVQIGRYGEGTYTVTSIYTSFEIEKLSGSPTISASETVACKYVNSSGFSVPTGTTPTKVTGWTKTFDTHGAFNPTTGTFTASEAGLYHVGFKFFFDNNKSFTATTLISAWIYKDNAQLSRPGTKVVEVTGATLYQDLQGDDLVPLNAGQTIDFRLVHGEGTSRELTTSGDLNYVYIYKVK